MEHRRSQKFEILKSTEKLYEQWRFFEKRTFYFYDKFLHKSTWVIGVCSLAYLLLLILTAANDYIILKGMSTVLLILAWITLLLVFLIVLVKKHAYRKKTNAYLTLVTPEQLNYQVEINDERIKIESNVVSLEFLWSDYKTYGINNNTIYVFNTTKPLESLYWSKDEMGDDNYFFLKEILERKSLTRAF